MNVEFFDGKHAEDVHADTGDVEAVSITLRNETLNCVHHQADHRTDVLLCR